MAGGGEVGERSELYKWWRCKQVASLLKISPQLFEPPSPTTPTFDGRDRRFLQRTADVSVSNIFAASFLSSRRRRTRRRSSSCRKFVGVLVIGVFFFRVKGVEDGVREVGAGKIRELGSDKEFLISFSVFKMSASSSLSSFCECLLMAAANCEVVRSQVLVLCSYMFTSRTSALTFFSNTIFCSLVHLHTSHIAHTHAHQPVT